MRLGASASPTNRGHFSQIHLREVSPDSAMKNLFVLLFLIVTTAMSAELKIGQTVKLRSVNYPNHLVSRLSNGRVAISDNSVGTEWIVRAGLAGTGISLESTSGGFLRHRNYQAWVDPEIDQDLYRKDASFTVEDGAAGRGITLRSVNYPAHTLRHSGYNLYINQSNGSDLFNKDSSFVVEPKECWRSEAGYRLKTKKIGKGSLEKMKKFCDDNEGKCAAISCSKKSCKAHSTTGGKKSSGKSFSTHIYIC